MKKEFKLEVGTVAMPENSSVEIVINISMAVSLKRIADSLEKNPVKFKSVFEDKIMIDCYIFDIDGTLADCSHRLHHIKVGDKVDWDAFFADCAKDKPITHIIQLAQELYKNGNTILYVSGRSDQCRDATIDWMNAHHCPLGFLYMRRQGDHRPDHKVKSELLDQIIARGYRPIMAFDDRNQVVKMWRERGIPCAQVADGDF